VTDDERPSEPDLPVFDDAFVRGGMREPSAEERVERARRAAEMQAVQAAQSEAERRAQRGRRSPRRLSRNVRRWIPTLMLVGLLGGVAWVQRGPDDSVHASDFVVGFDVTDQPTPQAAESDQPLGTPSPAAPSDAYAFVATQSDGTTPVAYDPCRPIRYVVNDRTVPPGGEDLVADAMQQISAITGLQFESEGEADEIASANRNPFQEDRYGDRWAPVLIAWSDPGELTDLEGDIAGIGGSAWLEVDDISVYVSGMVGLDGPDFAEILGYPGGADIARAIVLHELAHLIGLDHVDDPTQLMHPENTGQTEPGAGDRAGLVRLGQGECVPEL
jgi:hypothetical protein